MATTHKTLCWLSGICNGDMSYSYLSITCKLLLVSKNKHGDAANLLDYIRQI